MTQQPPLRWRRHRLATIPAEGVPELLRNLAPAVSLARSLRSAAAEGAAVDGAAVEEAPLAGAATERAAVEDATIELPELPDSPVDKAATLLRVAAQIEHALMVQYLYAGASLTKQAHVVRVTGVAVEEMSHLMTVQNLLRLIRQPPHLHRQDDDDTVDEDQRLFPFDVRLEPVSNVSLAKYVVAESAAVASDGVTPAVLAHIVDLATASQPEPINRVGNLYALLSAVFGTPELLHELATPGPDVDEDEARWYTMIEQVAAEAALFYGGPENVHLPDAAFDAASGPAQGSDADWDRAKTTVIGVRVHDVAARREALEALRDIGLQGEGPTTTVAGESSHFRRFYDQFTALFGADGLGVEPPPGTVRPLPSGARIVIDPGGADRQGAITHPTTAQWARLADLRYALLLGALERYLREPVEDRAYLRGWCFAEMYALRKLASLLGGMPAGTGQAATVAAVPFTPPVWPNDEAQWPDLAAAFAQGQTITAALLPETPEDPDDAENGHRLLVHLLASDERKLAESHARASGMTQRTRTDAVRDALDWAAGAGDPTVGHDDHGRFWNLQNAAFLQVQIGTDVITTRQAPNEDAPIVARLRSGSMPKQRPKLDKTGPEFLLIEKWVADGCPDDPV